MCPVSNLKLCVINDMADLNLKRLLDMVRTVVVVSCLRRMRNDRFISVTLLVCP